jgi:hypothetical protein
MSQACVPLGVGASDIGRDDMTMAEIHESDFFKQYRFGFSVRRYE